MTDSIISNDLIFDFSNIEQNNDFVQCDDNNNNFYSKLDKILDKFEHLIHNTNPSSLEHLFNAGFQSAYMGINDSDVIYANSKDHYSNFHSNPTHSPPMKSIEVDPHDQYIKPDSFEEQLEAEETEETEKYDSSVQDDITKTLNSMGYNHDSVNEVLTNMGYNVKKVVNNDNMGYNVTNNVKKVINSDYDDDDIIDDDDDDDVTETDVIDDDKPNASELLDDCICGYCKKPQ